MIPALPFGLASRGREDPATGCWLWQGAISDGYGLVTCVVDGKKKSFRVHRVSYEALVGPIPAGEDLDHTCRWRNCFNPAHLEPVTRAENTRRADVAGWKENNRAKWRR